jgi:hypothetical protein
MQDKRTSHPKNNDERPAATSAQSEPTPQQETEIICRWLEAQLYIHRNAGTSTVSSTTLVRTIDRKPSPHTVPEFSVGDRVHIINTVSLPFFRTRHTGINTNNSPNNIGVVAKITKRRLHIRLDANGETVLRSPKNVAQLLE